MSIKARLTSINQKSLQCTVEVCTQGPKGYLNGHSDLSTRLDPSARTSAIEESNEPGLDIEFLLHGVSPSHPISKEALPETNCTSLKLPFLFGKVLMCQRSQCLVQARSIVKPQVLSHTHKA